MLRGHTADFRLLIPAESRTPSEPVPHFAPALGLTWQKRRRNFAESLKALSSGPAAPARFDGAGYFRDCWVSGRGPREAFMVAVLWHALAILLIVPVWNIAVVRPASPAASQEPHVQLTWYGPLKDLPLLTPPAAQSAAAPLKTGVQKPAPSPEPVGADAFHPRQTILNAPVRPNHPRQTLIQPASAPEPPKILPPLPNMVQWNSPNPAGLHLDAETLARLRPKALPARTRQDVAAPELSNAEHAASTINISAEPVLARPAPSCRAAIDAAQHTQQSGGQCRHCAEPEWCRRGQRTEIDCVICGAGAGCAASVARGEFVIPHCDFARRSDARSSSRRRCGYSGRQLGSAGNNDFGWRRRQVKYRWVGRRSRSRQRTRCARRPRHHSGCSSKARSCRRSRSCPAASESHDPNASIRASRPKLCWG